MWGLLRSSRSSGTLRGSKRGRRLFFWSRAALAMDGGVRRRGRKEGGGIPAIPPGLELESEPASEEARVVLVKVRVMPSTLLRLAVDTSRVDWVVEDGETRSLQHDVEEALRSRTRPLPPF